MFHIFPLRGISRKETCFKKNGFTLMELLVVVGIIVVFSSVVNANFSAVKGQLALKRVAHQMVQDIREAQEMAMSSMEVKQAESCSLPLHFSSLNYFALGGHIAVQDAVVSCSVLPNPAEINEPVTFTATITGGMGYYSYFWSGDCISSESTCTKSFWESGIYKATITIRRGNYGILVDSKECLVNVARIVGAFEPIKPSEEPMGYVLVTSPVKGYGIYINLSDSNKSYKLYADTSADTNSIDCPGYSGPGTECWEYYTSADCIVKTINIQEKGVIIKEILNTTDGVPKTGINFKPPNPNVKIKWLLDSMNEVKIVLALEAEQSKTKTVVINRVGMLEIR